LIYVQLKAESWNKETTANGQTPLSKALKISQIHENSWSHCELFHPKWMEKIEEI